MRVEKVYMVRDSGNHDILFVTRNKVEAKAVHDWFETNTKPMYTSKKSNFDVKEVEVYTSPLEPKTNTFAIHVTTWDNGNVCYSVKPRSLTFSTVSLKHHTETWKNNTTEHYDMCVQAASLEEAREKANTLLEPYGVVLR